MKSYKQQFKKSCKNIHSSCHIENECVELRADASSTVGQTNVGFTHKGISLELM